MLIVLLLFLLGFAHAEASSFIARTSYCPQWSPDGKQIVFYSQVEDRWQIFRIDLNGSNITLLSNKNQNDFYPSFSPAGDRILFYSNRTGNHELYTMGVDGAELQRLTHNETPDRYPRWSPDGKKIAYVCATSEGDGICVMNANGSDRVPLTDPAKIPVISRISWSRDGSKIIFYSSNDKKEMHSNNQWAMFAVSVKTKEVKQFDKVWRRDSNPDWSRANNQIAVDANKSGSWESDDGGWEIYRMNPDGTNRLNLTRNQNRNDWAPAWSPDGKNIAYCSGMNDQYEIFIMNSDGTGVRRVTHLLQQPKRASAKHFE